MKLLLVLAVVLGAVYAREQKEQKADSLVCGLCHLLGPDLEQFIDEEEQDLENWMKKKCNPIPFLGEFCKEIEKEMDQIDALLKADECMSGCLGCSIACKCATDSCKPSCRKNCPSCSG